MTIIMNTEARSETTHSTLRSDLRLMKTFQSLAILGAVVALFTCASVAAPGGPKAITITPASGGSAISADSAAAGTSPSSTALTGPSMVCGDKASIGLGTLILNCPKGFAWDTDGNDPWATVTGMGAVSFTSRTAYQVTFTVDRVVGNDSTLSFAGLRVKPAAVRPLRSGSITRSGTATLSGKSSSNYGTLTEVAGVATRLVVTRKPSATATAGTVFGTQPQVTVQDAYGTRVASYATAVTAVETSGGSLNSTPTAQTAKLSSGVASFTGLFVTNAASGVTLTFASDGLASATSSGINVAPAKADSLTMSQQPSTTATAGIPFAQQPQVTVKDPYGNSVSDGTVVTAAETRGGNLNETKTAHTANTADGVASFSGLYVTNAATVTLKFGANRHSVVSDNIVVSPASASSLRFGQQPSTTTAGSAINPAVTARVQDKYGNTVTTDGSSVTIASSTTAFTGDSTLTMPAVNGVATFIALKPTTAGSGKTLLASATGLTWAKSGAFEITPAAASAVYVETKSDGSGSVVPAQNVEIGAAITVYAVTRDWYGNFVANVAASVWSLQNKTGGFADGDLVPAGDLKSAVFTGHVAGTATIHATSAGLSSTDSGTLTVIPNSSGGGNVAHDDFNRADASDLGGNWTALLGTTPSPFLGHLVTISNQAGPNVQGVDSLSYWSANTFSDDQYSQAVIPKIGYYATVIVRAGDSTPNRFYEAYVTATDYGIAKYWDGVWTTLKSGSDGIWHDGDTERLEVTGSAHPMTLTMYHNGSPVLTWTSSSSLDVKTGGAPGLGIGDRDGVGLRLDDWEGGDLSLTRLVITGSGTQAAGGSQSLTITAKDASGNTDTSYAGVKSLIFSGANNSVNPVTVPTVKDNNGTVVAFGLPTAITFSSGVATVSGGNNGAMTLYKAETATISVSDGSSNSSGSDRLTVAVSASSMSKFALSLTSPQINDVAFRGVNTLTAQDAYGNTVGFDASANNVSIGANLPLIGVISGLSGGNTLTGAGDFSSGVANLTALGIKYTGNTDSGTFTATAATGGYTGSSGSVTINAVATGVASDNFDQANAPDLGGNWTALLGTTPSPFLGHLVTMGNQAGPNVQGVDSLSYWSANTFSDNQYSQAVIPKIGYYTTVIVRAGDSTPNRFYEAYVTATDYGIAKYWDGVWTTLKSGSDGIWHDGDTERLEVTGSAHPMTLTMYHNGSPVLTWTSSSSLDVKTGGAPGLGIGDRDGVGLRLDDWEGGDL
jgi:hypothetical protein